MATPLILASQSPRRRELLTGAGYQFEVFPPRDSAECGVCSGETPPELVVRLASQKARDVAERVETGIVLGCDTVAECQGQVLGKPIDMDHARRMLQLLRGREHSVYSGVCLITRPENQRQIGMAQTRLKMMDLTDDDIEDYLETGLWEGKAGGFGLQDRHSWLQIVDGSESNVVGLPLELLAELLEHIPSAKEASRDNA